MMDSPHLINSKTERYNQSKILLSLKNVNGRGVADVLILAAF